MCVRHNSLTKEQAIAEGWFLPNDTGLCQCGCGEKAAIAKASSRAKGYVKGEPMQYAPNHAMRGPCNPRWGKTGTQLGRTGEQAANWKGGVKSLRGYVLRWIPASHPFACMRNKAGYVSEHRLLMAECLGRPLVRDEIVHHKNSIRYDNRIENLEILDPTSHQLHHIRRARLAEEVLKFLEANGIDPKCFVAGGSCGV